MWTNPSRGAPHHLRKAARTRDGNQCVKCGSAERLEVDHVLNIAHGGTHDLDNLQTLCAACHREKSQEEARQARAVKRARRRLPVAPHPGVR